ncbi:hypothetical protein J2847_004080 [Azospirillum agricola]|uniref:hypothetical protein n=1 Tax=Azospirillum agricola TaxID=1720247 RepID=UPI001AE8D24C|nr:hypothetical protein [Azospirillum agricola]MBP2230771.1 hypothetical protein [Azospirillum agricola]
MSKHTPGPWYVVNMRGWGGLCIGRRPQDQADTTAGDAPIARVIEKAPHWPDAFPAEANARLIAAAPDLLTALDDLTECVLFHARRGESIPLDNEHIVAARVAIARATPAE